MSVLQLLEVVLTLYVLMPAGASASCQCNSNPLIQPCSWRKYDSEQAANIICDQHCPENYIAFCHPLRQLKPSRPQVHCPAYCKCIAGNNGSGNNGNGNNGSGNNGNGNNGNGNNGNGNNGNNGPKPIRPGDGIP